MDQGRRHLEAARAVLGLTVARAAAAPRVERTLIVGEYGSVPLATLRPYLAQVARRMGVEPERLRLGGGRRFPPAQPSTHTPLGRAERVVADVDRVDVLTALAETLEAPRSRSLLQAGATVLGRVLRDPVVLEQALQRCVPQEQFARLELYRAWLPLSALEKSVDDALMTGRGIARPRAHIGAPHSLRIDTCPSRLARATEALPVWIKLSSRCISRGALVPSRSMAAHGVATLQAHRRPITAPGTRHRLALTPDRGRHRSIL